jgi:Trk K+ transport system NAD-binding subunit
LADGGHTVICGLERISLRVARALLQLGEHVTIVVEAPDPTLQGEARRAGARILVGRTADVPHLHGLDLLSARCLVLTEDADLRNVQAALAARDVNPGIRVVLRMFNAELADRATRLLANSRVVSSSAEAAPYFAAAALGLDTVPARRAWGRLLVVDSSEAFRSADGGAGPAGVGTAAARRLRATLSLATAEQQPQHEPLSLGDGEYLHVLDPPAAPRRLASRRLAAYRRLVFAVLDPRLPVLGSGLVLLIGITVAVFHSARGLYADAAQPTLVSWVDALVFTVTTAYGNTDLSRADVWVKLYAVGFMFAAALALAMTFGLVADVVIGARLVEALGVPRGHMRNHVVVLGLGNLGFRTVSHLLESGVEVAAADSRAAGRFVAIARRRGVPVLIADAHFLDSLQALSVDHARAVVAATSDDMANLEAALAARELNPDARVIARLYDQELAERAQQQLHITACQSVSALATPAFVAASLGAGVLSTIERGQGLWLLAEARVEPGSEAEGLTLDAIETGGELHVVAVRDGSGERWRPPPHLRLRAGSDVLVACSRRAWDRLCRRAAAPAAEDAAGAAPD